MDYRPIFFAFVILVGASSGSNAQVCPSENYYYISSQAEVDAFPSGCTEVTGDLYITDVAEPDGFHMDITDLTPLAELKRIGGTLLIQENWVLETLDGLAGLESLGGLQLKGNRILADISGLSHVNELVGTLWIQDNDSLRTLHGLDDLTGLTGPNAGIQILDNPYLSDISALAGIAESVGGLVVQANPALTSLGDLSSISSATWVRVVGNDLIPNLDGLSGLVSVILELRIDSNRSLANVDGLSSLEHAGDLWVQSNDILEDVDGLSGLRTAGSVRLFDNPKLQSIAGLSGAVVGAFGAEYSPLLSTLEGIPVIDQAGVLAITDTGIADVDPLLEIASLTRLAINDNHALTNLDGLSTLTSVADYLWVQRNDLLSRCSLGLYGVVSSGGVGGDITMTGNAPDGDCNNNGADLVDVTGITESDPGLPQAFALGPAYPNPFNPTTSITFELPVDSDVSLVVFDALGRQVQILESGRRATGVHTVQVDASAMPSGVYLYTLTAGVYSEARTMVLLR